MNIKNPVIKGDSDTPKIDSKNIFIFVEEEVDRCPTGSGVSGRMAIHSTRKEIKLGETMRIESIVGSVFEGAIVDEVVRVNEFHSTSCANNFRHLTTIKQGRYISGFGTQQVWTKARAFWTSLASECNYAFGS
jgi:hypothetical protein